MTERKAGPVRLDKVLGEVVVRHGLRDQVRRMEVLELWPELVGPAIAGVTEARGVQEGTLFVGVRTSGWLMELNMMKAELLERVNGRMPDAPLDRIVFVLAETG